MNIYCDFRPKNKCSLDFHYDMKFLTVSFIKGLLYHVSLSLSCVLTVQNIHKVPPITEFVVLCWMIKCPTQHTAHFSPFLQHKTNVRIRRSYTVFVCRDLHKLIFFHGGKCVTSSLHEHFFCTVFLVLNIKSYMLTHVLPRSHILTL